MTVVRAGWLALVILVFGAWGLAWAEDAEGVAPREEDRVQRFVDGFRAHEPLYFSFGWRDGTNARFQFSFRYRFVRDADWKPGFWRNLHFGYTQTSVWDLESESAPFHDTSYRPSFFYRGRGRGRLVAFEAGLEHESNGQDEPKSRSLNVFFLRPEWLLAEWGDVKLRVAPKFYAYVGDLSDNPDIDHYRGYVDLLTRVGTDEGSEVALLVRRGTRKHYGSYQLDITVPLDKLRPVSFDAYLHIQLFNGWGESLLDYDRKLPSQVRVGIMLVR